MSSPLIPTIAYSRIGFGVSSWLAPRATGKCVGIRGESSPLIGRLFASRDAALGSALLVDDALIRRRALNIGIAVDTADFLAAVLEYKRGRMGTFGAIVMGGGAALFAGLGAAALAQEK